MHVLLIEMSRVSFGSIDGTVLFSSRLQKTVWKKKISELPELKKHCHWVEIEKKRRKDAVIGKTIKLLPSILDF